ncbi:hypothetical protein BDV93DRAFT_504177 [Ceratobasidium sp. AG-I]|nr:hypothetical protein BDV93DRAFT_504177 [Ceratobasidium sp. AG-I]
MSRIKALYQTGPSNAAASEKALSGEGSSEFQKFDEHASKLDHSLRVLGSSIHTLGFSVGVLNATYHLRKALMRFQFHMRQNAAWLYEGQVKPNEKKDISQVKPDMKVDGKAYDLSADASKPSSTPSKHKTKEKENVLTGMNRLSTGLRTFVARVNEVSEFRDELLNKSFLKFAIDLEARPSLYLMQILQKLNRYLQGCAHALGIFSDQLNSRAFKERINKLAVQFAINVKEVGIALESFLKTGLPTILRSQEHAANGLQALSAVSLACSIASAISAQGESQDTAPLQYTHRISVFTFLVGLSGGQTYGILRTRY